ncbi:MAG: hypothetical protein HUK21_02880 [Fibrobacteraceae bacterium]|nr:hypothetical protein [Fibrobacteraceae bacterium]
MHVLKNNIVCAFVALMLCVFAGCAGSGNGSAAGQENLAAAKNAQFAGQAQDKQALLEQTFAGFIAGIQNGISADDMLEFLTDTSEYWLDTLDVHARLYTEAELDTCQFFEVYAILMYRLFEREHLWEVQEDKMLNLLLSKSGMVDKLTSLQLGPMKIKNDRGSVGLAKSPEVPIMLWEWDDSSWKLDLVETMPLITKGIESIAVKKNWSNKKLALYWVEKEYHMSYSRLDSSLFEPISF